MAQQRQVEHPPFQFVLILVAGALLGLQTGREVTVETVFEVRFTDSGGLNEDFLTRRLDQCSSSYMNYAYNR